MTSQDFTAMQNLKSMDVISFYYQYDIWIERMKTESSSLPKNIKK